MKIAFVNPPLISRGRAIEAEDCCWGAGPLVLPAMLLACASEAKRAGEKVAFIDLAIDGAGALSEFEPDVSVHALAWQWWHEVNEAMQTICCLVPRVILAIPSGYASVYSSDAWYVLADEPEKKCGFLPENKWHLEEWARFVDTPFHNSFDRLGPVDYSLVPDRYWPHYRAAVYQVTRGCPYRCTFCVWGGSTCTDPTFKMRPAAQVADNLKELREIAGEHREKPLPLYLLAAQLTTSKKWIEEFHAEMAGSPYPFQSNVNLGEVTAENITLLKEAGLVSCASGIDAVSDEVLSLMKKPYTFERAMKGLLVMQEAGMLRRTRIRYGVGETQKAVEESCANLDRLKAAGIRRLGVHFAPIIHYEGTAIKDGARYKLEPLPGAGPERLVMANPPDWSPFVDKLKALGWLGSVGSRK